MSENKEEYDEEYDEECEDNEENLPVVVKKAPLEKIVETQLEEIAETQLVSSEATYKIAERVAARLAYEPEDDDPRDQSIDSVMDILHEMPETITGINAIAHIAQDEMEKYLAEQKQVSSLKTALIEKEGTDIFYEIKNMFNCVYTYNAKIPLGEFIVKSREVIKMLADNLGIKSYTERYKFNGRSYTNASDALEHSRDQNFQDPLDYQASLTFKNEFVEGKISTVNKSLWFPLSKTEKKVSLLGIISSAVAYLGGAVSLVAAGGLALASGSVPACMHGIEWIRQKRTYANGFSLVLDPVNNAYSELDLKKYTTAKESLDDFFNC